MFAKRFKDRLTVQQQAGLYRDPPKIDKRKGKYLFIGGREVLNFSSNDYLGLGTSKELRKKVADNFKKFGTSSSSSRLVSGNYSIIAEAENRYAKYFGYEAALFFPSGYQANVGLVSTLFEKGDTIIFDKHIHSSSVKGITLSKADFVGYNHNSMIHLEKRLLKCKQKQAAVITESLFSMDGDLLDTDGFKKLKDRYGFLSIVDEAHAFGMVDNFSGESGCGVARGLADIAVGTFGKALGLFGAFVLLPFTIREYLLNFSSPLIYTTTLPEAHAASAMDILDTIAGARKLRTDLRNISLLMKESLRQEGFSVTGDAHILAIEIGDETKALEISKGLLENNIFIFAARHPTVPLGRAILRIGMTALHTENDVSLFIKVLKEIHGKVR